MSAVREIFESSRNRSLGLSKRSDLTIVKQVYRHEPFWLIKDPLEMEFYRLNQEEYAVLEMVDGENSLDEIKAQFERQFAPQRITHRQLQTFISDLHKKSLLAYSHGNVGPKLVEREKEKKVEKLKKAALSVLSIQWRGVDPDRFLDFITPRIGWIFSLPMVFCSVAFMISAALWLLVNLDAFLSRLPSLQGFLAQGNWLLLGLVVVFMKVAHELAHGISFKRFGGECHEIGVMLLVLIIPTLYCDTTDSWLIKSKWKRAAIGAAGMYIELLIAAAATFLWWFSSPGTLNSICLNIMASGALSVVILNGNPFFKFDGYYIFSDLFELPNLWERSGKQTQSVFLKYGLGIDEPAEPNASFSTKLWLVGYKVLAFVFKVAMILLIKFMLIDRLNHYGLGYLGLAIGVAALGGLFLPPLFSLHKFFEVPGRLQRIEMKSSIPFMMTCAFIVILVAGVPLPHSVSCPFTIEPRESLSVYVRHDAILRRIHVEPWQWIDKGQLIVELENLDSSLELARLETEGNEYAAELDLLEETREPSPNTTARIAKLREALATNRASTRKYDDIVQSFRVVASRSGQVIPEWTAKRPLSDMRLESFDGSPLERKNIGSWLKSGQKLCTVGDLRNFDAVLVINEHDISFVEPGQSATLMLDAVPERRFVQPIRKIAKKETEKLPGSLAKNNGGSIQLQQIDHRNDTEQKPADEHFEARVEMPELDSQLSSGLRGQARIRVGSKTIFQRMMLLIYRSFRKKLA